MALQTIQPIYSPPQPKQQMMPDIDHIEARERVLPKPKKKRKTKKEKKM